MFRYTIFDSLITTNYRHKHHNDCSHVFNNVHKKCASVVSFGAVVLRLWIQEIVFKST